MDREINFASSVRPAIGWKSNLQVAEIKPFAPFASFLRPFTPSEESTPNNSNLFS